MPYLPIHKAFIKSLLNKHFRRAAFMIHLDPAQAGFRGKDDTTYPGGEAPGKTDKTEA